VRRGLRAFDFDTLQRSRRSSDKLRFEQRDGKLRNLLESAGTLSVSKSNARSPVAPGVARQMVAARRVAEQARANQHAGSSSR